MYFHTRQEKWDGHTHSEFCPHGSREKTHLMVERAIELGFQKYSITEHAPTPKKLLNQSKTPQDAAMIEDKLHDYFSHVKEIQKKYASKIKILVGLEVDYLLGMENDTQELLTRNEPFLDEVVYALHYIPDEENNLRILDRSAEDCKEFFPNYSIEKLWEVYWRTIEKMLTVEWIFSKPMRLAHFCLIEKYHKKLIVSEETRKKWIYFVEKTILPLVIKRGYSMDWNVAGLRKEYCQKVYWYQSLTASCKRQNIPLVYGSDAHAICEVGANFDLWENFLQGKKF